MKIDVKDLGRAIDLHMHSLLSDGSLLPAEIVQRASKLHYEAIAITDHVDQSNLEFIIKRIVETVSSLQKYHDLMLIPGVELTHIPPAKIETMAKEAKKLGASLVIVHGETPVEPTAPGTNRAAVLCEYVDVLAHPGLISEEEAELARENGTYLEITTRKGHCLANGHVAKVATKTKAKLILNSDSHDPSEILSQEDRFIATLGSGLSVDEALKVLKDNPRELIKKLETSEFH